MIPDDYDLTDAEFALYGDVQRFENHAADKGLFFHLEEGRITYTPLATAWAPHWHASSNPVGWPTFKSLAHRDVAVSRYGMFGDAADWCDGMKFKRQPLIVARPALADAAGGWTLESTILISYVLRFDNQKDAAMFKLVWSDRVGA